MQQITTLTPGIIFSFVIALIAWFLGKQFPIIGGPVIGILLGMIITQINPKLLVKQLFGNTRNPQGSTCQLEHGVKYTSKKLLQYSIILLGFEMNLLNVFKVGAQSLLVILSTLAASFITAYLVGKILRLHGTMVTLVGVGTSICGGSAIAATAPVIKASDQDVAQAVSTIFLFNIMAVFIFPALGHWLHLSDTGFGMWAGTAINDTSSVVAAGASWSAAAGNNTALTFATIVKLTRTMMIVPITLALAIYTARKSKHTADGSNFSFIKVFPWFVIGFVTAASFNTLFNIPIRIVDLLVSAGKFGIIMAMVAIGLNTRLKKLLTNGSQAIFLGICCWFMVATVSLAVQTLIKIW